MTTARCDHDIKDSCEHCEIGCAGCGDLEAEQDDDCLCEDCSFDRALMKADLLHDMWKEGD